MLGRLCFLYGTGSIAGALVVLAMWLLGAFAEQLSYLAFSLDVEAFFTPMVFGGLGGLLYLIRTNWSMPVRALVFSLPVAIIHLAYGYGWFDVVMFREMDVAYFMRPEAITVFVLFALVWGSFTKYVVEKSPH